ncbi:MAG TPA: proton-conducting transporter membrane subunit [Candidatus Obscuribacterales bacterium]
MNLQLLLQFLTVPLALISVIWLVRNDSWMTRISAVLFWLQVAIVTANVLPVALGTQPELILSGDLRADRLGSMFIILTQVIAASSMTHAVIFFKFDEPDEPSTAQRLRFFYTCATLFLLAMTSVFFCNNLGLMWISVEATTLCSAPLVYFHRGKHALEATWKYLIICSVGIAFALFGTMFLFASSQHGAVEGGSLRLSDLLANAGHLHYALLKLGYLFCLLGYGTKAGVFPLHSWLPDAHAEAPAPASAMLSGGLLNCALFAIWRISQVVNASGHSALPQIVGVSAGVVTVLFASIFLIRQHGIKRLLAYSSIENVGLILTAIGLNSAPLFFILALNHSAAKVALFLLSGNIVQANGTKSLSEIRGLLSVNPYWTVTLILAVFAVTGAPPFGAFIAEWQLLAQVAQNNLWLVFVVLLGALALSFLSITMHIGKVVCGTPREQSVVLPPVSSTLVPACLIVLTLICGLTVIPKFLW